LIIPEIALFKSSGVAQPFKKITQLFKTLNSYFFSFCGLFFIPGSGSADPVDSGSYLEPKLPVFPLQLYTLNGTGIQYSSEERTEDCSFKSVNTMCGRKCWYTRNPNTYQTLFRNTVLHEKWAYG
jgi:hypothetical protein